MILQNRFQLDNSYAFPKAILHEGQRSCKFIFTLALFIVSQAMQCIVLAVQCFDLQGNKDPSVLLPTKDKRITIIFQENHFYLNQSHLLNLGNQYHKGAT